MNPNGRSGQSLPTAPPPADVECDLDLTHSSRKVWLIKVPEFVAKTWREAMGDADKTGDKTQAAAGKKAENKAEKSKVGGKVELGSLTLSNNNTSFLLSLNPRLNEGSKQLCEDGISELDLVLQQPAGGERRDQRDMMLVAIRDETGKRPNSAGKDPGADSVETDACHMLDDESMPTRYVDGVVQHRLDVDPTSLMKKRKYSKVSRSRFTAAEAASRHDEHKEKRKIQVMTDNKIVDIRKPIGVDDRRQRAGGSKSFLEKRVAMESQELLAILFGLFSKQSRWTFAQLQKETAQPTQHLKTVLGEIARMNKVGPYKGTWELSKESTVHV